MKILVSGGRNFDDIDFIIKYLDYFHHSLKFTTLIAGGARGVDTIAEYWADEMGVDKRIYPVSKEDWAKLGKKAGILRNGIMLKEEKPDFVMIFPGGNGTKNMIERTENMSARWISQEILFKKEDIHYGWMSNFAKGYEFVDSDGLVWETSEHHYQAQKATNEIDRGLIQMAKTPKEAKDIGNRIVTRTDWKVYRDEAMEKTIELKFPKNSIAAQKLIDTGDDYLVEYAPWENPPYWGVDNEGRGENKLGKILMKRRDQLAGLIS